MEPIGDILAGKRVDEPPEVQIIKRFVRETYHADCAVTVQQQQIIIGVKSGALAGTIRPQLQTLREACHTDKRLVLRITG